MTPICWLLFRLKFLIPSYKVLKWKQISFMTLHSHFMIESVVYFSSVPAVDWWSSHAKITPFLTPSFQNRWAIPTWNIDTLCFILVWGHIINVSTALCSKCINLENKWLTQVCFLALFFLFLALFFLFLTLFLLFQIYLFWLPFQFHFNKIK